MMDIKEIKTINDPYFDSAMRIYEDSFPANERHAVSVIKQRMIKRSSRMFIGLDKKGPVLVALFWSLRGTDFILFDYMAVAEPSRNKGFGTYFIDNIPRLLGLEGKYLVLEVEDPLYGNNRDDRSRRLNFYKRIGAKELKDVKYILPPLSGSEPTDMILMMMPTYKSGRISGKVVKNIIVRIYKELYDRDEDDILLNSFIHKIPRYVEL